MTRKKTDKTVSSLSRSYQIHTEIFSQNRFLMTIIKIIKNYLMKTEVNINCLSRVQQNSDNFLVV